MILEISLYMCVTSLSSTRTAIPTYVVYAKSSVAISNTAWGSNIVQPTFANIEALQRSGPWQPLASVCFPHAHSTCLFLHLYTVESSKK